MKIEYILVFGKWLKKNIHKEEEIGKIKKNSKE